MPSLFHMNTPYESHIFRITISPFKALHNIMKRNIQTKRNIQLTR